MKRFWKWVVDHKISTIRKWQSVVLHQDRDQQQDGGRLKPIGGSDDELERKQKRNSRILQAENNDYHSNTSLRHFDIPYNNEPVDFEEFFDQSTVAIESALDRGHTTSISNQRKPPVIIELSSSPSLDSPSGSFRRDMQSRRPTILITNTDNNSTEVEDDFNDEFDELPFSSSVAVQKQSTTVPQMLKLFSTEPCNFLTSVSDESSTTLPTSSISSNQSVDNALEVEDNQTAKCRGRSLTGTSSSSQENWKEKFDEKKKKSSLQHFRLYNMQIERPLSRHRSAETLPSLTSAQIHLIRNIWRQVYVTKGPTVIGSTLLYGIFFKSRRIKEQFFHCPFPHPFPNRDSFNKAHAKAIGEMLDKIVDNLENLELTSGYLFSIGATHANLVRQQSSNEMWNLMAETFIDCTLDWGDKKGRTEASRKAWAYIIAFVIEKIKRGHLFERRQLAYRRRSSTITSSHAAIGLLPSSAPTIRFWKSVDKSAPHIFDCFKLA